MSYCQACGAPSAPNAAVCVKCGVCLANTVICGEQKSKIAAALLGIFLGSFGIHRFYLGYNDIAIVQLILGLLGFVTCGITTSIAGIWGFVEGILILTGSLNVDAQGRSLKE